MKIKIYQINTNRDERRIAFFGLNDTKKLQKAEEINSSIYDIVYSGEVDCKTLEDVYQMFNISRPEGHKGWSLSVSDIIEVIDSEKPKAGFYFCDMIGFTKIEFDNTKCGTR